VSPHRVLIPHSRPTIGPDDLEAVTGVLLSGDLAQGEQVRRLEAAVAGSLARRGGVATSSGTSALHLALLALGVGAGDEVIMPSYTCVAVLQAARYVGATVRLAEIDPDTYGLDPAAVRRRLSARTRAIIVPHMFGLPADVGALNAFGVPVIEDCAQAFGAATGGRPAGSLGTLAVCSFYATKVLTAGEGGMVLADSNALLDKVRDLRDYDGRRTLVTRFNYKMTDLAAALGLSQLRRLPEFLDRRRILAARYTAALAGLPIRPPAAPAGRSHIYFRYVARAAGAAGIARRLRARGIDSKPPVFRPLHRYLRVPGFSRTEAVARTALSLPIYPSLSEGEVDAVVDAIRTGLTAAATPC
jgi:perosamine synthetase